MEPVIVFLNQVVVLFLMLLGMIIGDSTASSIFGRVEGNVRQFLYLLLFVFLIVSGNYIPSLIGNPSAGLLDSILLFSFWGFISVFLSRLTLFLIDLPLHHTKKIRAKKQPKTSVDIEKLIKYLRHRGMEAKEIKSILHTSTCSGKKAGDIQDKISKGRLKGKIQVNPYKLSLALHQNGFNVNETLDLLIRLLGLTPEKAAMILERST